MPSQDSEIDEERSDKLSSECDGGSSEDDDDDKHGDINSADDDGAARDDTAPGDFDRGGWRYLTAAEVLVMSKVEGIQHPLLQPEYSVIT